MKIILVRHGSDEEGYRGGWSSRGLTDEGIRQSERLAEHLQRHARQYCIRTLLSSDLTRAAETVRVLKQGVGLKAELLPAWREMNNGLLAGMPHSEAEAKYPGVYFNTLEMDTPFPGGETPAHFYERITRAFDELCAKLAAQQIESNVMLVTHGGVINALYYHLSGERWTNRVPFFPAEHTSMHVIEQRQDQWVVSEKNSTSHL